MSTIDEKRVYGRNSAPETVLIASEQGVAAVSIAGGRVGTLSLRCREPAVDVASADGRTVAATTSDVLDISNEDPMFLEFGSARAVALDNDRVLAADEGLSRFENGEWHAIEANVDPVAIYGIDGDLLASESGVFRLTDRGLEHAGLESVAAVASAGPYAASATGLYELANGWTRALDGEFSAVAAMAGRDVAGRRAHAIGESLFERTGGQWHRSTVPVDEPVRDVAYGRGTYAVTEAGTLLIRESESWRTYPLGVSGVRAVTIAS